MRATMLRLAGTGLRQENKTTCAQVPLHSLLERRVRNYVQDRYLYWIMGMGVTPCPLDRPVFTSRSAASVDGGGKPKASMHTLNSRRELPSVVLDPLEPNCESGTNKQQHSGYKGCSFAGDLG